MLTIDDMYCLRRVHFIPPHIGLVPVPYHLFKNDPPQGCYISRKKALYIGLRFLIPQVVAHFFITYDLNLAQINPNGWRTLLSLVVVSKEHVLELEEGELRVMYCVKMNGVDKGKAYISTITLWGLILKLLDNQPKGRISIFILVMMYETGNLWFLYVILGIIT